MGIDALCVGRCDSESFVTHGFRWTNTNQQQYSDGGSSKRNENSGYDKGNASHEEKEVAPTRKYIGQDGFMRRATRKTSMSFSKVNKSSVRGAHPVYSSGVVFYLDRSGNIQGVMLWGLLFSRDPKDVHSNLNGVLVERMEEMIRSNGGAAIRDRSSKIFEAKGISVQVYHSIPTILTT